MMCEIFIIILVFSPRTVKMSKTAFYNVGKISSLAIKKKIFL